MTFQVYTTLYNLDVYSKLFNLIKSCVMVDEETYGIEDDTARIDELILQAIV